MTTDVKDNSRAQLNTTYSGEIGFKFSESAKPMTPEETVELLVEQVPSGNKIIQLLPNKRQRIVRDYHQ